MEKNMETTIIMGYLGTTMRMHSFIPSYPKVSLSCMGCPRRRLQGLVLSGMASEQREPQARF